MKKIAAIIAAITLLVMIWVPVTETFAQSEAYFLDGYYYSGSTGYLGLDTPVSKRDQAIIDYNVLSGGTVFKGAGECYGYAESVRKLFGSGSGKRTTINKKATKKNMYNALKNCKPGTHVRYKKAGGGYHSIVVYKVTKDYIYYSEGNVGGVHNGIRHGWEELGGMYSGIIQWILQPTGTPKTSEIKIAAEASEVTGDVRVVWRPVKGVSKYTVYRSTSKNGKYKKVKTVRTNYFTDITAPYGTVYYKVKAKKTSKPVKVKHRMAAPVVTVTYDENGNTILSWNAVKDASKYRISYFDGNGEKKTFAITDQTSYTIAYPDEEESGYRFAAYEFTVQSISEDGNTNSRATTVYIW